MKLYLELSLSCSQSKCLYLRDTWMLLNYKQTSIC